MAVEVTNLIAAIKPDIYCDSSVKSQVKRIAKEKGILEAAKVAKSKDAVFMDLVDIEFTNAAKKPGFKAPIEEHTLIYDSFSEGAEPVYFWILDMANNNYKKVTKLVDNFVSSPGSTHFSEMGMKATKMQEEGMKMLGSANQVLKSILNIIFDLKEFKMRLALYDRYHSGNKEQREAALLSLKQTWLDQVDTVKRGNSSIKALALSQQGGFVTLIDAFMAVENEKLQVNGNEVDLNDRIKRVLKQRIGEFQIWLKESERELRKRYEIERKYLRSQVNTVKLYARWAKPYLKSAKDLEQRLSPTAALVTAFNTSIFEVSLLCEKPYDPKGDVQSGILPSLFLNAKSRKYSSILVLNFKFRSSPERSQQGYGFRGRTEVKFTSYALNDGEISLLKKLVEEDDIGDLLKLISGTTTESLDDLKDDLDEFLEDKEMKKSMKEGSSEDTNPFSALATFFKKPKSSEKKASSSEKISSDTYIEAILRSQAIIEARKTCYLVYDVYKKQHKMPSIVGYT